MAIRVHHDVVDGPIKSGYACGRIDKAWKALQAAGYTDVISLEDEAYIRLLTGYDSDISQTSNVVRNAIIYVPDTMPRYFMTKNFKHLPYVHKFHKRGWLFYLSQVQADEYLEDAIEIPMDSLEMETKNLSAYPAACDAFGPYTSEYGNLLNSHGKKTIPIILPPHLDVQVYVSPIWFEDVERSSTINGDYVKGDVNYRVRGVKRE